MSHLHVKSISTARIITFYILINISGSVFLTQNVWD